MLLRDYSAKYGLSESCLSRYRSEGINIDDPQEVFRRRTEKRSRRGISKTNRRHPITSAPAAPGPRETGVSGECSDIPLFSDGEGLMAAVTRFREAELHASRLYSAAVGTADASVLFSRWVAAADQLRRIEETRVQVETETGDLVPLSESIEAWSATASGFKEALDAIPARMSLALEGLDAIAIEQKLKAEMRVVLATLSEVPK